MSPSENSQDVLDLVRRWAAAEEQNDSGQVEALLTADFVGVGPVGFVLSRQFWLGRFAHGLVNHSVAVEEPQVHDYDGSAMVVGVLTQRTTAKGEDASGRFRLTLHVVQEKDEWLLAGLHIGPLNPKATRPPAPPT